MSNLTSPRQTPTARHSATTLPFESFVDNAGDGVIVIDSAGTVLEWNAAEARITGIPPRDAVGQAIWKVQQRLIPGATTSRSFLRTARSHAMAALAEGTQLQRTLDEVIERADGERRSIQSVLFGVEHDGEHYVGCITRDLTEHKPRPVAPESAPDGAGPPAEVGLSDRERDVLDGLTRGLTYAKIAALLGLSTHTVHAHVRSVYVKLRVGSRGEAAFAAVRDGLLRPRP